MFDVGIADDGRAYLAMELLEGESLAARLRRGALAVRTAVDFARQIADALAAAHAAGIVHRDLKPDNVFVLDGGGIKLLDFGVAKLAPASAGGVRTETGAMIGTPLYMSPEQCDGARDIDARSDLYALGCVLFAMVTGRPPFEGEGTGALIGMHLHVAPPLLRSLRAAASPALEAVVARLLAKSPDDRHASAREVADALADPAASDLIGEGVPTASGEEPRAHVDPDAPTMRSGAEPPRSAPPTAAAPPRSRLGRLVFGAGAVATAIAGTLLITRASRETLGAPRDAGVDRAPGGGSRGSDPTSDVGSTGSDPWSHGSGRVDITPRVAGDAGVWRGAAMALPDYDPSQLDLLGYIPQARVHARAVYPDAEFVEYVFLGDVPASGKVDLRRGDSVLYTFRSEQESARHDRRCYVMVNVYERNVFAGVAHPVTACDRPFTMPRCTIQEVWARASAVIGTRTVARFRLHERRWHVSNEADKRSAIIADDCR
jgi:hypothetical protein